MANETNAYVSALRIKGTKEMIFTENKRGEILKKQEKRCYICKKHLRPYYYKFQTDPKTKEMHAICSDCAVIIPKR